MAQNTLTNSGGTNSAGVASTTGADSGVFSWLADSTSSDLYFWIMIGFLMMFVLVFLLILKQVRKARLAAYPDVLSGLTNRYSRNHRRATD